MYFPERIKYTLTDKKAIDSHNYCVYLNLSTFFSPVHRQSSIQKNKIFTSLL